MSYKELSIRQIYERYIGRAVPYRRVRVVSKRPAQSYRGDAGHTHSHTHHSERPQQHRDTLLYQRCLQQEALYFYNTQREDRPQEHHRSGGAVTSQPGVRGQRLSCSPGEDALLQAIMNLDRESGGAVTSQPEVRGQRLPCSPGEDALLQAIMNLDREADGDGVRSRSRFRSRFRSRSRSRSRSARVPEPQQNTSATRPKNQPENLRTCSALSGGSKEDSPHASASASKIFFSELDVIPGLGGEPEEPTVEEQCAQAVRNKARDIEKLYKQDCETLGMVVKMLISKDPTLELKLLTALTQNLVDIREKCLENLRLFISEVNALLKPK